MKFDILLTPEAEKDFKSLTENQQELLKEDYKTVKDVDLDAVNYRSLDKGLFEIKTKNLRSLYDYRKGKIILVSVIFVKDSQKTPKFYIERAKKILKKYN